MVNYKLKAYNYKHQITATCEAAYEVFIRDIRGQETAKKLWKSITEGVEQVLVFYDRTRTEELSYLWNNFVSRREMFAFECMLNGATANKKELDNMEKIILARYLPAVLKVVGLILINFHDCKEGDDDELKKAIDLFKERHLSLNPEKKPTKSEAHPNMMGEHSAAALTEILKKLMIVKNKKDAPSSTRQYQCRYGCMAVFSKKNDLFCHQKETNRACKYKNADQLPVKRLPQSELTLLDMIWNTIGEISEDSLIPIPRDEGMDICMTMVKGIRVKNESMYEKAMDAIMMGIECPLSSEFSSDGWVTDEDHIIDSSSI